MSDFNEIARSVAQESLRRLQDGYTVRFEPEAAQLCEAVTPGWTYHVRLEYDEGVECSVPVFTDDEGETSYALSEACEGVVFECCPTGVYVVPF